MPGSERATACQRMRMAFLFTLIASVYLIKTLAIVFSKTVQRVALFYNTFLQVFRQVHLHLLAGPLNSHLGHV